MSRPALLRTLLDGPTGPDTERRILGLLATADGRTLNDLLESCDVDALLGSLDNRLIGPDHRTALIELLTVTRRRELGLRARADLIHALQTGSTDDRGERAIVDLVTTVRGPELTHLKNLLNLRQDFHDLEGLVFADLDDPGARGEILAHIAEQAATTGVREAKVFSDIDDTAFSRLKDRVFRRGALYPGVLAFWDALDDGPHDEPFDRGDLTFVTARPMDVFGLLENHSREALRRAGVSRTTMLSGGVANLHSNKAIAAKKLENIAHYAQLFPEYDLVLVGDSGQGDVLVGQTMLERYPDAARAVFIHDVLDTPEADRAAYAERRVFFHDTYAGAAVAAHRAGLISAAGLARVCEETRKGFATAEFTSPEARDRAYAWLERDLATAA